MNYFSQNLKSLRAQKNLSQEKFGQLFDLSKSNINSYENGFFPKIEKFIQIMDHFNLDPSKFISLDMERDSVLRGGVLTESVDYLNTGIPHTDQFQFLEEYTWNQIRDIYIKLFKTKEHLLRENAELKEKYINLLERSQKTQKLTTPKGK